MSITLWNKSKHRTFRIHRLVAKYFIPNPENKPCIDHINTDKTDNRVENLRWCTNQENQMNPLTRKHLADSQKIKVQCIETEEIFDSIDDAVGLENKKHFKRNVKNGWKINGYHWRYL